MRSVTNYSWYTVLLYPASLWQINIVVKTLFGIGVVISMGKKLNKDFYNISP